MIAITANTRQAILTSTELITSGSAGIPVQFSLSNDWNGLTKIAVFRNGDDVNSQIDIVLTDDLVCSLPQENCGEQYLDEAVFAGIYGSDGNGNIIIPTIWVSLGVLREGVKPGNASGSGPTPDMWAQIIQIAETSGAENAQLAQAAQEAAETAQGLAETAQGLAETAQGLAEAAQTSAETAQTRAENAQSYAELAQTAAESAQTAAETAQGKAEDAQEAAETAQGLAEAAQSAAETAQGKAEDAQEAIEDMSASATTLPEGSAATVTKTVDPETGAVNLEFGIPKGDTGDQSTIYLLEPAAPYILYDPNVSSGNLSPATVKFTSYKVEGTVRTAFPVSRFYWQAYWDDENMSGTNMPLSPTSEYTLTIPSEMTGGGTIIVSAIDSSDNTVSSAKIRVIAEGLNGEDGFDPVVASSSITGGHQVSITDSTHTETFNVMDGEDGADAVSYVIESSVNIIKYRPNETNTLFPTSFVLKAYKIVNGVKTAYSADHFGGRFEDTESTDWFELFDPSGGTSFTFYLTGQSVADVDDKWVASVWFCDSNNVKLATLPLTIIKESSTAEDVSYDSTETYSDGTVGKELSQLNSAINTKADVIVDSVGPAAIASFPDGANNMPIRELNVTIDPIQDLHGQANPYPEGGDKNILPMTLAAMKAANTGGTWVDNVYTVGSLVFTVLLDDGGNVTGINVNGSTGGSFVVFVAATYSIPSSDTAVNYAFSGVSANIANVGYLDVRNDNGGQVLLNTATSATFNSTGQTNKQCRIVVLANQTMSNVKFYPMLCLSSATDPTTFAPYSNLCPISGWTGANMPHTGINLNGGQMMIDTAVLAGCSADRVGTDEDGRYYKWYSGYAANTATLIPKWYFKPNTRYTLILAVRRDTSVAGMPNLRWFFTDGTNQAIGSSIDYSTKTIVVSTSASGKTVSHIGGYYSNGYDPYFYVDESGLFEGVLTEDDFVASQGSIKNVFWQTQAGTVLGGILTINEDGSCDLVRDMIVLPTTTTWANPNSAGRFDSQYLYDAVRTKDIETVVSDSYKTMPNANGATISTGYGDMTICVNANGAYPYICIKDSRFTTGAELKAYLEDHQIVYKTTDVETYHLDNISQIFTKLGTNNIWFDCGQTKVTYPCDTKLYIDKIAANIVAALS